MAEESNKALLLSIDCCPIARLPDHLLVEIFIRVPIVEWGQLSCVSKNWADLFRQDCLWRAALIRCFPLAGQGERWPGPIPRGMSKRRFIALYMSKCIFALDDELSEIVGHSYLFLKEQLEISTLPPSPGILHGTIIGVSSIYGSRSYKVLWKIFERLFTDFRDFLGDAEYYDLLAYAKQKFQPIPATWLGY